MSGSATESNRLQFLGEIENAVCKRFPVQQLLKFSDLPQLEPAPLPKFVGLIASILEATDKPCCIVLPDSKAVALGVSTLIAVTRLRTDFPDILRKYASVSFKTGTDNVLVRPSGLVYRYEGFFTSTLFKLGVIDRRDSRSLPVKEIARLEKTTRKRPKGYLNSDLGQSQRTILGSLLGISIPLNRNLLRNYVLVLGARKSFVEELDRWKLQIADEHEGSRSLKDEVPFGKVVEAGNLTFLDGYVAGGEPLVAVASRAEDLAAHCVKAQRFTKAVLVDDIDLIAQDLRAYDAITESQRTVILASDVDRDSIRVLKERGCEIWRLTPDEILLGLNAEKQGVPFRSAIKKAFNMRGLVISELSCGEENLDRAVGALKEAADAVSNSDNGTIRELLFSAFRMVMFCAEYLGQDSERFVATADRLLQIVKQHLRSAKVWLPPEINDRIEGALTDIKVAVVNLSQCSPTPKGKLLLESLAKAQRENNRAAAVVARAETDCKELKRWLSSAGIETDIYLIGELPESREFDQVLVVSWPRSDRFDRLIHQYLTSDVRLLAYPFEENWLRQYRKRYKRSFLFGMSRKRKMQLIGTTSSNDLAEEAEDSPVESAGVVKFDLPEEQFLTRRKVVAVGESDSSDLEEFVDACYIDFAGPTFAYLTDGHELPVLNNYISVEQGGSSKIPLRSIENLRAGDYVAFRESGDSDIIRFLAEDEIGKDAYQRLRSTAGRWRIALRKLGGDPKTVWEQLKKVGFSRHLQTVRGWLVDESRICPQDLEDVRKIAEASRDSELLSLMPELQRAKDRLMSLHISAGSRLTELLLKELPKKIGLLGHGETEVDLGVGKVWIVHIQELDRSPSPQRRSQINRLLWDERGL